MTQVTYTASRELVSGHTAGLSYYIDIPTESLSPIFDGKKNQHVALNGATEVIEYSAFRKWQITTQPLLRNSATYNAFKEFLNSCRVGEAFSFDAYGTYAAPVSVVSAILEGYWTETRENGSGYFKFSFELREL